MDRAREAQGFEKLKSGWREAADRRRREAARRKSVLLEQGSPVFERFGVEQVVLFGSVSRGESAAGSDIDLLVCPLPAEAYWDFKFALEEAVGYPCDIHTETDEADFVKKIRARGEVVFGREP